MIYTLHIIQIISSIILIALILVQQTQGDTGSSLGGDNASFFQTRRGAEKFIFIFTIITAIIFIGSSLAVIVIQ